MSLEGGQAAPSNSIPLARLHSRSKPIVARGQNQALARFMTAATAFVLEQDICAGGMPGCFPADRAHSARKRPRRRCGKHRRKDLVGKSGRRRQVLNHPRPRITVLSG